jgi:DNA polymerase (family 10)
MRNSEVARLLYDISEQLELSGENIFKIRAYSRAARTIEGSTEDIEKIAREKRLEEIPGVRSKNILLRVNLDFTKS